MRHNWSFLLVVVFMFAAGAAERASAWYVNALKSRNAELDKRFAAMMLRTDKGAAEMKKYAEIKRLAGDIGHKIRWEQGTSRIMPWFEETAADVGVGLIRTHILPPDPTGGIVAGGAFQKTRFEVQLRGPFWGLVQYVARIERWSNPMVIEDLTMTSDREVAGFGQLNLVLASLYPVPQTPPQAPPGGAR